MSGKSENEELLPMKVLLYTLIQVSKKRTEDVIGGILQLHTNESSSWSS